MRREGATYQEQHEFGRHNTLSPEGSRYHVPSRGFRAVCLCCDIVLKRNWALCHVVTSTDKGDSSWRIDYGGLIEEVISEEIKALDSAIFEGRVREVGFET